MIAPERIAEILGLGASVRTVGELESALEDQSPLGVARTELGARRVEGLLEKLFFGLPA
jgi:uncharacterized protein (DUF2384 family)